MTAVVQLLREIYADHKSEMPPVFKWHSETGRQNEFFYCLIQGMTEKDEADIQNLVTSLATLHLLNIEDLADASIVGGTGVHGDKVVTLIQGLLNQAGFSSHEASECTFAMCTASKWIYDEYQGKMQRFARKYANLMRDELRYALKHANLPEDTKSRIVSHWLQNAYELPIPASNKEVDAFCSDKNITIEALTDAADTLGVNVAFIDDLIKLHLTQAVLA